MSRPDPSRRRLIRLAVVGLAAAPLLPRLVGEARASLPRLEETDPTAAALGYRHDTTQVDQAKYPNHRPDQNCANCNLVQGAEGEAWRPCAIFPGKLVNANGWCAAWVKKAG
ncbi:MAG: high-potential iron-sulfur protein [Xanthomonadales bacterium]|nr:high-potential iron-sulfur protein [Xanthomonadales bacterium]